MSRFPGSPGLSRSYLGRGLNGEEEGVGIGDRAKLEAGQEMKRSTHTFRSSLKTSAVEVKYGMTFLQCGHPVERERECYTQGRGEAAEPEPFPGPLERPFRECLSLNRLWGSSDSAHPTVRPMHQPCPSNHHPVCLLLA